MNSLKDTLRGVWSFLEGKKTYIVAACIFVVALCHYAGLIDPKAYEAILGLLTGGGLVALRASKGTLQ